MKKTHLNLIVALITLGVFANTANASNIQIVNATRVQLDLNGKCTNVPYKAAVDAANIGLIDAIASATSGEDYDKDTCSLALKKYLYAHPGFDQSQMKVSLVNYSVEHYTASETPQDDSNRPRTVCKPGYEIGFIQHTCDIRIIDNTSY